MRNRDAVPKIKEFKEFKGSNFSGAGKTPWTSPPTYGQLPYTFINDVNEASYVVYSWATPIGWYVDMEGWSIPSIYYSKSTTVHQRYLRKAVTGNE